jgi:hypothetical protein
MNSIHLEQNKTKLDNHHGHEVVIDQLTSGKASMVPLFHTSDRGDNCEATEFLLFP